MGDNIGCIDPHGMWPFPKDRESCPKCQAIRAAQKPGLPYGWWKDPRVLVDLVLLVALLAVMVFIGYMYFLG